jgi:hypothetical protein
LLYLWRGVPSSGPGPSGVRWGVATSQFIQSRHRTDTFNYGTLLNGTYRGSYTEHSSLYWRSVTYIC